MPLTEIETLKEEQRKRVETFERFLDDKLAVLRSEIKTGIFAHVSILTQNAYTLGKLEAEERQQAPQRSVDMERYKRNAQGTPGDGTTDPCTCGHQYHRHFDWMDDYREGCKYCPCQKFTEPTKVGLYGGRDK